MLRDQSLVSSAWRTASGVNCARAWRSMHLMLAFVAFLLMPVEVAVADPQTQIGQTFRDCAECPEMVVIPAGTFTMGASLADTTRVLETIPNSSVGLARVHLAYEHPEHPVAFARPFALGKYHVTRAEFAAFVRETAYATMSGKCFAFANHKYRKLPGMSWQDPGFAQSDRDPVLCVSWQDARAYIDWLNGKLRSASGRIDREGPYRLPSEAEWEYAARAGTRTSRWWGDEIGSGNAVCDGCGSKWDKKQTASVGSFRPNPFGVFDVLGNAWQWAADCWNQSYVGAPQDGAAWTSGNCRKRVFRGGAWTSEPWILRSSKRSSDESEVQANYVGFRVAKTLP